MTRRIFIIDIDHSAYNKNQFNQILEELNEMAHVKISEANSVNGLRLSDPTIHIYGWEKPWKDTTKTVLERTRLWVENKKPVFEPSRWYDHVNATRTEFQEACDQLVKEGLLVIVAKDQCSEHGHDLDNGYCWECDANAAFDEFGDPQVTEVRTATYYYHKDKIKNA